MGKTMRNLWLILASLLTLAVHAHAQNATDDLSGTFVYRYDLDATTLTFCKLAGQNGDPFGASMAGTARIKTTGSSTSITAVTAGQNPFATLTVDDVIIVRRTVSPLTPDVRVITAKTDADNVTVETAVNWDTTTGFEFRWYDVQCGTTDADGWIDASNLSDSRTISYDIAQINTTSGVDMRIECKQAGLGAAPVQVFPASGFNTKTVADTAATRNEVDIGGKFSACRVGLKITSTDDGGDTGANAERIIATITK